MLIRIRSRDGNFRFDLDPAVEVTELLAKIQETSPDADPTSVTISNQPRGGETNLLSLKGRTLKNLGLKHGDLIFVGYKAQAALELEPEPTSSVTPATPSGSTPANRPWEAVQETPVDVYWRSKDGKIPRPRDAQFCKHGPKGMCDYCMPLEPYDQAYHKEHAIKHLSFHSHLRKITPKQTSDSTSAIPPLNPLSYRVKVPCSTGQHANWPTGICSTCQPSAITLQPQGFRMVDHLEIASPDVINRFLQAWRMTGLQRFGWLIGHYQPYDKVPMGIKAVVEAICEPPQEGELDGLSLGLPWEDEQRIRDLSAASSQPLTIVGYIFTDLDPTPEDRTKNVYKRHPGSFYLSSLEAIFAGTLQRSNPTPTKSSPTGSFSSRLVTAILTATEDGQVDVSAYQVSEQCVAMVEADMIEASVDPGIVRLKEEDRTVDNARYIPDVFFTYKNEYGLEVKKSAKPSFPVEYLIVNVTHGFPQNPSPVFQSTSFEIENRPGLEYQTIEKVMSTLRKLEAPDILDSKHAPPGQAQKRFELARFLSDWHLIAFLGTTGLFSPDDVKVLMKTATSSMLLEDPSSLDALFSTGSWHTLMTFTRESAPAPRISESEGASGMDEDIPQELLDQIAQEGQGGSSSGGTGGPSGIRICPHCTFENTHRGTDCEVCGLPL